jgi:hypothetical protein
MKERCYLIELVESTEKVDQTFFAESKDGYLPFKDWIPSD